MRVQIGAAVIKATAAQFVQDNVKNSLPICVMYQKKMAS
jgi:hypothetical protein